MTNLGRNAPCHCGSGKKYKKCCLKKDEDTRRDEQELREFEYAVRQGYIDPFASDEDWEEEPEPELPEDFVVEDFFDEEVDGEPDFDDWYDDMEEEESREPLRYASAEDRSSWPDEELQLVDAWWDEMENMVEAGVLHDHISRFMDQHPQLVRELGLEYEPMSKLYFDCCESNDYQLYFDLVSRLRREFPDVYKFDFPTYDKFMLQWLLRAGKKEQVAEYLDNFRRDPAEDTEALSEMLDCLFINNCHDILAGFIPELLEAEEKSPYTLEDVDLLHPMLALIMAPFLDEGSAQLDMVALSERLKQVERLIAPDWLQPEQIRTWVECILGKKRSWNLEDCTTRLNAINLYDEVAYGFMGWLHNRKALDWSAAAYYRMFARLYLFKTLPRDKRPRALFPVQDLDIGMMFQRFEDETLFWGQGDYFAMLNSLYWFVEFLEETQELDPEVAAGAKSACGKLFDLVWQRYSGLGLGVLFWEKFPREL